MLPTAPHCAETGLMKFICYSSPCLPHPIQEKTCEVQIIQPPVKYNTHWWFKKTVCSGLGLFLVYLF